MLLGVIETAPTMPRQVAPTLIWIAFFEPSRLSSQPPMNPPEIENGESTSANSSSSVSSQPNTPAA